MGIIWWKIEDMQTENIRNDSLGIYNFAAYVAEIKYYGYKVSVRVET